jgi:hypothetical protein
MPVPSSEPPRSDRRCLDLCPQFAVEIVLHEHGMRWCDPERFRFFLKIIADGRVAIATPVPTVDGRWSMVTGRAPAGAMVGGLNIRYHGMQRYIARLELRRPTHHY